MSSINFRSNSPSLDARVPASSARSSPAPTTVTDRQSVENSSYQDEIQELIDFSSIPGPYSLSSVPQRVAGPVESTSAAVNHSLAVQSIMEASFKPLTDYNILVDLLTKYEPNQRSTETLYKLANKAHNVMKVWQEEYMVLDARISNITHPNRPPVSAVRHLLSTAAFEGMKEADLYGYFFDTKKDPNLQDPYAQRYSDLNAGRELRQRSKREVATGTTSGTSNSSHPAGSSISGRINRDSPNGAILSGKRKRTPVVRYEDTPEPQPLNKRVKAPVATSEVIDSNIVMVPAPTSISTSTSTSTSTSGSASTVTTASTSTQGALLRSRRSVTSQNTNGSAGTSTRSSGLCKSQTPSSNSSTVETATTLNKALSGSQTSSIVVTSTSAAPVRSKSKAAATKPVTTRGTGQSGKHILVLSTATAATTTKCPSKTARSKPQTSCRKTSVSLPTNKSTCGSGNTSRRGSVVKSATRARKASSIKSSGQRGKLKSSSLSLRSSSVTSSSSSSSASSAAPSSTASPIPSPSASLSPSLSPLPSRSPPSIINSPPARPLSSSSLPLSRSPSPSTTVLSSPMPKIENRISEEVSSELEIVESTSKATKRRVKRLRRSTVCGKTMGSKRVPGR